MNEQEMYAALQAIQNAELLLSQGEVCDAYTQLCIAAYIVREALDEKSPAWLAGNTGRVPRKRMTNEQM